MENRKLPLPIALAVLSSLLILGSILSLFLILNIPTAAPKGENFTAIVSNPIWLNCGYFICIILIALGWIRQKTLPWFVGIGWLISVIVTHLATLYLGSEKLETLALKLIGTCAFLAYLNSKKVRAYLGIGKLDKKKISWLVIFSFCFILIAIQIQLTH
jgi:hypothetical protein